MRREKLEKREKRKGEKERKRKTSSVLKGKTYHSKIHEKEF